MNVVNVSESVIGFLDMGLSQIENVSLLDTKGGRHEQFYNLSSLWNNSSSHRQNT